MDIKVELSGIDRRMEELQAAIRSIQQPRSTFQIEKFVVRQHDTLERQYHQCVLELYVKYNNIRRAMLQRRRLEIDIRDLAAQDEDERRSLDLQEKQYDLEDLDLALLGAVREFEVLYSIFCSMPQFTYEEIQAAEEGYWRTRLTRQAAEDIGAFGHIGVGNRDSLWMAGFIEHPGEALRLLVEDNPLTEEGKDNDSICHLPSPEYRW